MNVTTSTRRRITGGVAILLGAGALAALPMIGAAAAATPSIDAAAQQAWREALAHVALPAGGCFKANYPDAAWTRVACVRRPQRPFLPRHGTAATGVNTVGDGNDYAAAVSSLISQGVGSFYSVSGVTSEKSLLQSNAYTLQLNSNFFSTTVCDGALNPSSCLGWQQFVYENDSSSSAFMQYWLINWGVACPSGGWMASGTDCYRNSAAVPVPRQALSQLASLAVTGTAVANGTDTMMLTTATSAYVTTGSDSVVKLADYWTASEYNIIGDGDGSKAKFNTGTSITVEIGLKDGATAAPVCESDGGTTAETNNLTLGACKAFAGPTPTIGFIESN
jgi:hypothetical protein